MNKGILIDQDGDLMVRSGTLAVGDSTMQEVALVLKLNQGEQKFVPVIGANIIQLINAKAKRFDIENRAKLHLALDNKNYDNLKEQIQTNVKT